MNREGFNDTVVNREGFKGTVVNREGPSLNRRSLKITLTVPLSYRIFTNIASPLEYRTLEYDKK